MLELLRSENHPAYEGRHAADEGHRVAEFAHPVPRPEQRIGKDLVGECIRCGEVEHIGSQHQEAPEHQYMHRPDESVPEDALLPQPARHELAETRAPRAESVVGSS